MSRSCHERELLDELRRLRVVFLFPMSESVHCHITYRPVRLGWLLGDSDPDSLRSAVERACMLWGGTSHPILTADMACLFELAKSWRVDAVCDHRGKEIDTTDPRIQQAWPWPFSCRVVWDESEGRFAPLDVRHSIEDIADKAARRMISDDFELSHVTWRHDDPLAQLLCVLCGAYPASTARPDYVESVSRYVRVKEHFEHQQPLRLQHALLAIPRFLAQFNVNRRIWGDMPRHCVLIGSVSDTSNLVALWNLWSQGTITAFYDPTHHDRTMPMVADVINASEDKAPTVVCLGSDIGLETLPEELQRYLVPPLGLPNDMNELASFSDHFGYASVGRANGGPSALLPLERRPYQLNTWSAGQFVAVSVSFDRIGRSEETLSLPFVPQLNHEFGRLINHDYSTLRVQKGGEFAIICGHDESQLDLNCINADVLFRKTLFAAGINSAEVSAPGRIARRLVAQLGGPQGCRALKIPGVRTLIFKYSNGKSFKRQTAEQIIGTVDNGKVNLGIHRNLFLEPRSTRYLNPQMIFDFLVNKGVFLAGIQVKCAHCELPSWVSIDRLAAKIACEYCGSEIVVIAQLKDRDWFFQFSGLFRAQDNQAGAIPVALTMQQLDTELSYHHRVFSTSRELNLANGKRCEVDLMAFTFESRESTECLLVECKSHESITGSDVENLVEVADSMRVSGVKCYIMFSKLLDFNREELDLMSDLLIEEEPRLILATSRELEGYRSPRLKERRPVLKSALWCLAWQTALRFGSQKADYAVGDWEP